MVKIDHLMIAVSDWKRSRDWYVRHLGFAVEFEVPDGGHAGLGAAAILDDAGLTLFLEETRDPIQSGQAAYTLQVDDVDDLHRRLTAAGVTFISPPSKLFWGYGAVLADPDGHRLGLYDEASMAAKG